MGVGAVINTMWKWILGAAVFCGAAGIVRSEYEKRHFSVEEFEIVSGKIKEEKAFVFLSDLHNQEFGKNNEKLLQAIDEVRPDMVIIGGDMMVTKKKKKRGEDVTKVTETAWEFIEKLAERYPVFYGNGNHEQRLERETEIYGNSYDSYIRNIEKAGVIYLSNENAEPYADIAVAGVNIPEKYYKKRPKTAMKAEEIEKSLGKADSERFQILLSHSPLYFEACREWGADLTLSGHFHGGTIRLPWLGGVMTPQFQFFYPRCAGKFEEDGKWMIVSRGLGTHSIRIRFNNKPQVVVVRLKKETIF